MENDLYHRKSQTAADSFFEKQKNTIVLHYLQNETTRRATWLLPAATFAEADGTVENNEGRAQRVDKTCTPDNEIEGSGKWKRLRIDNQHSAEELDEIGQEMIKKGP